MTTAELLRSDLALIADLIPLDSRVLDLGCGDGQLLEFVRDGRGARVNGVELELENVAACIRRDIPVIQADLDDGLAGFPADEFDYVVLSQTLQVVRNPSLVLREMLRVGHRGIVSFPNFGHWRVRSYLALKGRMPVSRAIPYSWYDTPNIHHTTLKDFSEFVATNGGEIERAFPLRPGGTDVRATRLLPNLRADTIVALVRRAEREAS